MSAQNLKSLLCNLPINRKSLIALLLSAALLGLTITPPLIRSAPLQTPTIVPLIPNDPAWQTNLGEIHDLPNGFGWIDWLKSHPSQETTEVVALIADGSVDCTHPEIRDQCLPQLAQNLTDEPFYLDNNGHGPGVTSAFVSTVNNHLAALGTAGYGGKVRFIPDKTLRSDNTTTSTFLQRAYQHALDLKAGGVNIKLLVVSSTTFGDSVPQESLRLIRLLKDQDILIVAAAGSGGVDLDHAAIKRYPAAYGLTESNVRAVAATDPTGLALEPTSAFGSNTIKWAALGRNVPIYAHTDPTGLGSGSGSGTSFAAPLAAGIYAAACVYRGQGMTKVLRRLDRSCRGPVSGVGYGVPRLGKTLEDVPVTLLVAPLESVTQKAEPFGKTSLFASDSSNRLVMFLENVDAPLALSEISIVVQDSANHLFTVMPEAVREVPQNEWITQVNFKLPPEVAAGGVRITITARGTSSMITTPVL